MIELSAVLSIVALHFISDFICQTDKMALNKSSSNKWLLIHVSVYSIPFFVFGWQYAVFNASAHAITDWFSSRAAGWLWLKQERHWFFVVIGLDQAIHMATLFGSYNWLVK